MKHVFLIDIDGTLVPVCGKRLSDSLLFTIKKLQKMGHVFVVATGRSLNSSQKVTGLSEFDYFACLMGLVIYDNANKKYIQKINLLNYDSLKGLINYLIKEKKLWFYKNFYADYTINDDKELISHQNLKKVTIDKVKKDLVEGNIFQIYVDGEIDEDIKNKYINDFEFIKVPGNNGNTYYDISAKNVDKSFIVDYFRKKYKDYKIVAIGDSGNDIGMFKVADISVAMGNAKDEIKAVCDVVTSSCENNGVEEFLKQYL